MHELSLAEAVNKTIEELARNSGWKRVRRIILKVGHMRQVDPELLSFAFGVVAKDTVSEGAEISILEVPVAFHCNACGEDAPGEKMVFACMRCGSTDVDMLSGMELTVESMEVDQEE